MTFVQLTYGEIILKIESFLLTMLDKLYRMGIRGKVCRKDKTITG